MMTDTKPKPEPEVADRQTNPPEGGHEWMERAQKTIDMLELAMESSPFKDPAVQMAWVELCAAIRETLVRVKNHG
jgi:hypothetical protein